jgi:retinaldehyde-binding protein 1
LLPDRDKYGRAILLIKGKNVKPVGKCILRDILTAIAMVLETLSEIEEFHIRGVVYIIDVSGLSSDYLKIFPVENAMKLAKNSERCATGRHKGIHVINVPSIMNYVISIALKTVSQKMRDRVKFYKSFDDESFDVVDRKCLPKEYGGTVPMEEMSSKNSI